MFTWIQSPSPLCKVLDGKIAIDSATQLLQKSRRTVEHYLSFYRKEGNRFAFHGNKGRAQTNKIPEPLKKRRAKLLSNAASL